MTFKNAARRKDLTWRSPCSALTCGRKSFNYGSLKYDRLYIYATGETTKSMESRRRRHPTLVGEGSSFRRSSTFVRASHIFQGSCYARRGFPQPSLSLKLVRSIPATTRCRGKEPSSHEFGVDEECASGH
jgi:hypothetical protein